MGEDAAMQIINAFVDGMVRGRALNMLLPDGRTARSTLHMDRERTWLSIAGGAVPRPVRAGLEGVNQIVVGTEAEGIQLPLDDLCVTLVLEDGQIFGFCFEDEEARDTFALCMGMFVDARRQEVEEAALQAQMQPQPAQAPQSLPPAPGRAQPAGQGLHAYKSMDFWGPTWCQVCNVFLSGVSKQGQSCQACNQIVCHSCARKGDPCKFAAQAAPAAGQPPAASSFQGAPAALPPAPVPSGYPAARGVPAGMDSARGVAPALAQYQDDGLSSARSAGGSGPSSKGKKELTDAQKLVKKFVQKMVRGRELRMLSTSGRSLLCLVQLDREIRNISIQLAGKKDAKQRFVSLKSIDEICVGEDVSDDVALPVDENSVTLVLEEGQAIAFQLENLEARDTFAMCMGMFVDGNRKDAEARRALKNKR